MKNAYWDHQKSVNTSPNTAQNLEGHHNSKMIIDQEVGLGYLPISFFNAKEIDKNGSEDEKIT